MQSNSKIEARFLMLAEGNLCDKFYKDKHVGNMTSKFKSNPNAAPLYDTDRTVDDLALILKPNIWLQF